MRPTGFHDDKEKDLTPLRITELSGNSFSPLERLNWFESNNPYYPRVVKLVDTRDLKSLAYGVTVRSRPRGPPPSYLCLILDPPLLHALSQIVETQSLTEKLKLSWITNHFTNYQVSN